MKTKKEYKTPQMKVCKVHAKAPLMESSGGYTGGGAFKEVVEKDHYA
ncbi:hypothetical protein [Fibrobacter sp. UWP2]|nr:hypothetical protein [Fibrobacter sp. UWP2]SHJ43765.1 hypothetical protein SAMN05720471_13917 [Fibrobacter sp. UWP2]